MTARLLGRALYQEVADLLRERIYHQELVPGQAIDEKALCLDLGISRTPLREALKVLHADGLVTLEPRRGCHVATLDGEELNELFSVMAVLEGLCAREMIQHAAPAALDKLEALHLELEKHAEAGDIDAYYERNYEFHEALQKLSGNRYLQRVTADLRRILTLARHQQLRKPGRLQASIEEHRKIIDALRKGYAELAEACMKNHLLEQAKALTSEHDDLALATTGTSR